MQGWRAVTRLFAAEGLCCYPDSLVCNYGSVFSSRLPDAILLEAILLRCTEVAETDFLQADWLIMTDARMKSSLSLLDRTRPENRAILMLCCVRLANCCNL